MAGDAREDLRVQTRAALADRLRALRTAAGVGGSMKIKSKLSLSLVRSAKIKVKLMH